MPKECVAVSTDNCPSKDPILSDARASGHTSQVLVRERHQMKRKSILTCEIAPFFLYNPIKTATHSNMFMTVDKKCK